MSVARREWKSMEELRAWIRHGARATASSRESERVPELVIVHQPPRSGKANWRVIEEPREPEAAWTVAMRSVITRAELQFDLR